MQPSVIVLERLKRQMKRNARLAYAAQERQRAELQARLTHTEDAIEHSRQQPMQDDMLWLAEQHAHRLRLELRRREEVQRLNQQSQVVEQHRSVLRHADREARLMELLVEQQAAEEALLQKRAESRKIDSLAISRWFARCA